MPPSFGFEKPAAQRGHSVYRIERCPFDEKVHKAIVLELLRMSRLYVTERYWLQLGWTDIQRTNSAKLNQRRLAQLQNPCFG
uniref:Uncharacterized protein n=1 Tax=Trichuris muris TaxID=70415 RepID=A0A5S6R619_TRIMR